MSMRRLFAIMLTASILLPVFAAIYPVDAVIGQLGEGSPLLQKALREPYSLEWLEANVEEGMREAFNELNSEALIAILPLGNPVMSRIEEGRVYVHDLDGGEVMTVFLGVDGLIRSLSL